MSVEAMAIVLHHSRARGTAKLVLLGIANHEGDGGAWPQLTTLARYANSDVRTVQRSIDALIAEGELAKESRQGGTRATDPRHRPNLYRVLVQCPPECDGSTAHRVGDNSESRPDASVQSQEVRPDTSGGYDRTPASTEPSLEPSDPSHVSSDTHERAGRTLLEELFPAILERAVELRIRQAEVSGSPIGNRLRYATTVRDSLAPILTEKLPRWIERFNAPVDVMAAALLEPDLVRQLALYERRPDATPAEDEETLEEVHALAHAVVMRELPPTSRRAAVVHAKVAELIVDDGTRLAMAVLSHPDGSMDERLAAYEELRA